MDNSSQKFGKQAEDLAACYLRSQGFTILEQNYRFKRAEIDIIAKKDDCICFIEVKARKNQDFGYPETFVTSNKEILIIKAAENYIFKNKWESQIRFDIISILRKGDDMELVHFEDAFA